MQAPPNLPDEQVIEARPARQGWPGSSCSPDAGRRTHGPRSARWRGRAARTQAGFAPGRIWYIWCAPKARPGARKTSIVKPRYLFSRVLTRCAGSGRAEQGRATKDTAPPRSGTAPAQPRSARGNEKPPIERSIGGVLCRRAVHFQATFRLLLPRCWRVDARAESAGRRALHFSTTFVLLRSALFRCS